MKLRRKYLTALLCIFILAAFALLAAAAVPSLISAEVVNNQVVVNQPVSFKIVTSTNADKIKIINADGTTYCIADINDGFTDYEDYDGERIWTVSKTAQFLGISTKTVKAGSRFFGYAGRGVKVRFGSFKNILEITDIPPLGEPAVRGSSGSFLQSWLVREWSQERWNAECTAMADSGMEYLILQSVADISYNTAGKAYGENYTMYPKSYSVSMYPSALPEFAGSNNGIDSLERCLIAAKASGIKVFIGPVSDDRWWLFGWGVPTAPSGSTDLTKDSYFAKWMQENADLNGRVAQEIYTRYSASYGDVLAGWYYYNEIWNIDSACAGTDGGVYAKIISAGLNKIIERLNAFSPNMQFMISPFYNTTLSTAEQNGAMWKSILSATDFRKGDIFAPQDCVGNNPDSITNGTLDNWTSALKSAADSNPNLEFWSNNENFTADSSSALLDRYIKQIEITSKYAKHNICFSWNHYYSPLLKNPGYDATYRAYLQDGELDSQPPAKPQLSKSGYTINLSGASDNIGVCGYYIYQGNESNLTATLICSESTLPNQYSVTAPGTYYIAAYDFANNKSEPAVITIP